MSGRRSVPWERNLLGLPHLMIYRLVKELDGAYGYEIAQRLRGAGVDVHETWVYSILTTGARLGRFEVSTERSKRGPARKLYRLTPEGHTELERGEATARRWISALEDTGG